MKTEMTSREAIDMMQRCMVEIKALRAQIEVLRPKAEAYDNMVTVLGLLPRKSQGMGEDICWILDKRIQELTPSPATGQVLPPGPLP